MKVRSLVPYLLLGTAIGTGRTQTGATLAAGWSAPPDTVSGTVRDLGSSRVLVGAGVYALDLAVGTSTDTLGRFSLVLPGERAHRLRFSSLGYRDREATLLPGADRGSELYLYPDDAVALAEVVVSARGRSGAGAGPQTGLAALTVREVRRLPTLLGEADVLHALRLHPGIPSGSEGNNGLYVRGGGSDQNLVLVDGATVYNPYHLFGFFSTFNTDAVGGLELYKSGFPARYGGRLSSVVDVSLREGSRERLAGSGGIGLLSSRLSLEGPIQRGRSSFIVSGRRTYVDLITAALGGGRGRSPLPRYNFYDLDAKLAFDLTDVDKLTVAAYHGRDAFRFDDAFFSYELDLGFTWGNSAASATWRHLYSDRLVGETRLTGSRYGYAMLNESAGYVFDLGSGVRELTLRNTFTYTPVPGHTVRFGNYVSRYDFTLARVSVTNDADSTRLSSGSADAAVGFGGYAADEFELGDRVTVNVGIRLSAFANEGKVYVRPEPRLSASYRPRPGVTLRASYARMQQYNHLVSGAGIALPIDLWYPSTRRVRPQVSDQVAVGAEVALPHGLTAGLEAYTKRLGHLVDFADGANLYYNRELEGDFSFGRGYARGLEARIERRTGRLQGWVGYTLQRTRRGAFPDIMGGRYFSPRYDRRHDLSVVAIYEFDARWRASATWVYGSGDLQWVPGGRYTVAGATGSNLQAVVPVYGDRNNYRLIPYHRADLSASYRFHPRRGSSELTFGVFNAYSRRNAFFVYIRPENGTEEVGAASALIPRRLYPRRVSLFPLLPSVTWNFKFGGA